MPDTSVENAVTEVSPRRNWFGVTGLLVSLVGLALSVLTPWLANLIQPPPKPVEEEIADFAAKIVKRVKEKLKKQQPLPPAPPKQISWPMVFPASAISTGLLGLLLGVISWIKREDHRISGTAVAIGTITITWQYIILAVAIVVGLVIFAIVFANLDLG